MIDLSENKITLGQYIIIQRQNYTKLHKFNSTSSCISLGRDNVELAGIEGCRYYDTFKMILKNGGGKHKSKIFRLELVVDSKNITEVIDIQKCGVDNRDIIDDGTSQKLSKDEIEAMRETAASTSDIVAALISNSNSFHNKTEYSQDKYLKKKEKKYFEYIKIRKPTLRLLAELMYRQDPAKVLGLRIDTLAQIVARAGVQGSGRHLLYDSGSNGLLAGALLKAVGAGTSARLLHLHPGNHPQRQAMLALHFPPELADRCLTANLYSVLRHWYQIYKKKPDPNDLARKRTSPDESEIEAPPAKIVKIHESISKSEEVNPADNSINGLSPATCPEISSVPSPKEVGDNTPEVNDTDSNLIPKKNFKNNAKQDPNQFQWQADNEAACSILQHKVDSLVVACREHPLPVVQELLRFVGAGRPLVVLAADVAPLQECYVALRARGDVAALHLTCGWMRGYQVLPERTHPEITMNNNSGYLLTGYVLK